MHLLMRVGSAKKKKTRPAGGHESRRAKRHSTNLLSCELGTVGDISATGMRVICPTKPPVKLGQAVGMKLESTGQRLPIKGKVVWIRRKGLRSYQVGIQFIDVSASIAAALESMAMFGFIDLDSLAKKRRGQEPEPQTIRAAFELPDYYKVLGVRRRATVKEIKHAYRLLALKYHPDVNQDPAGVQRFIQITEAYDVLCDPKRRKSYDRRLAG